MALIKEVGVSDMIKLDNLTEDALLKNVDERYKAGIIYTYTGTILVSVNPYKILPIYNNESVKLYCGRRIGELPPHIFATADTAYRNMREMRSNQSVIISGESGAGKSEATKLILQYLAAMTDNHSWVEQQIMEANTILESFGNAKTVRNNNSSRFGKFIEIHFAPDGKILGARFTQYLLEKSRLVQQAKTERNYHIFYQLCAGASPEERKKWFVNSAENYVYLNQGGAVELQGVDDSEDFQKVKLAMNVLGIGEQVQETIFKMLAAILILGEVQFESAVDPAKKEEGSKIKMGKAGTDYLEPIGQLIGVDPDLLNAALTKRKMKVRGQEFVIPLKLAEAIDTRDALCKALYGRLFNWLVDRINSCISRGEDGNESANTTTQDSNFIGVLDIFGFENFAFNSFEQMCINYANEKLQQFFNQHIFKLEQEEYTKEKIAWESIAFTDNQECLDLIEKRPVGILSLLDEECRFPNGTDASFLDKLNGKVGKHKNYATPKRSRTAFLIKHYAGEVQYEIQAFLDKNKDTLYDDLLNLIQGSEFEFISELFADYQAAAAPAPSASSGSNSPAASNAPKKLTVGAQFKEQLNSLVQTLGETTPHYVRCIKPNKDKVPDVFTKEMVLEQLRYSGMLETIRIRRAGYPIRFQFENFFQRYRMLAPKATSSDLANANLMILQSSPKFDKDSWKVGVTKVFMRDHMVHMLDDARKLKLNQFACKIQRIYRTYLEKKKYKRLKQMALRFQTLARGNMSRKELAKLRRASIVLQAVARMVGERGIFVKQKRSTILLQCLIRRALVPSKAEYILKTTKLQAVVRTYYARRDLLSMLRAASILQTGIRIFYDMRTLANLKKDYQKRLAEDVNLRKKEEERKKKEEEERKFMLKKLEEQAEKDKEKDDLKKKEMEQTRKAEEEELKRKAAVGKKVEVEEENIVAEMDLLATLDQLSTSSKARYTPAMRKPIVAAAPLEGDEKTTDALGLDDIERQFAELEDIRDEDIFAEFGDIGEQVEDDDDRTQQTIKDIINVIKDGSVGGNDDGFPVSVNVGIGLGINVGSSGKISSMMKIGSIFNEGKKDVKKEDDKKKEDAGLFDTLDKLENMVSHDDNDTNAAVTTNQKTEEQIVEEVEQGNLDEDDDGPASSATDDSTTQSGGPTQAQVVAAMKKKKKKEAEAPTFNVFMDFTDLKYLDWADKYIKAHMTGTFIKKPLTTAEMISFTKSHITDSMLKLPQPNLVRDAVEIFSLIMKFMGDMASKKNSELECVNQIIKFGLQVPTLRDEIYVQAMRQVTKNPKPDSLARGFCILSFVCSSFKPSDSLLKYFCSFCQSLQKTGGEEGKAAGGCLKRLQRTITNGMRKFPPSSQELAAMKASKNIIVRINLMDGKAKAVDYDASSTVKEMGQIVAQKIGLIEKSGFALFEQLTPASEHIALNPKELLGDILYRWEIFAQGQQQNQSGNSDSANSGSKMIFKKKIFINPHVEPQDPVAKDLLFYQALDNVVNDRFPCNEIDAMRLASLYMQIVWGDHDPSKVHIGRQLMNELDRYIPKSMVSLYSAADWKTRISEMHATLKGRTIDEAKDIYMQHVKKWSLYGSTVFKAAPADNNFDKKEILIAVNQDGIHILSRETKSILETFDHSAVTVTSHTNETFDLTTRVDSHVRRFKFKTKMGGEIEPLLRTYGVLFKQLGGKDKKKKEEEEEEHNFPKGPEWDVVLPPPIDIDRYSFKTYAEEALQPQSGGEVTEFSWEPIAKGLHRFDNTAIDKAAVECFGLVMKYMGDWTTKHTNATQAVAPKSILLKKMSPEEIAQQIVQKAVKQPKLRNEVFAQLIKQTNGHPKPDHAILGWHLICLACASFLPSKDMMNYLRAHLQEGAKGTESMEIALLAGIAQRKLQRCILNGNRNLPPSTTEIEFTKKRRSLQTKVMLLDGRALQIASDGSMTIKELFNAVVRKVEMKEGANQFSLFELVDGDLNSERVLKDTELLGDVLSHFEESQKGGEGSSFQIVFKRKDWFSASVGSASTAASSTGSASVPTSSSAQNQEVNDPVFRELTLSQLVYNVINERFPVTEQDILLLTGLHIFMLWGPYNSSKDLITQVVAELERFVPKTIANLYTPGEWKNKLTESYQKVTAKSLDEAKSQYLTHLKKWTHFGCTIFHCKQTLSLNLPKELWLGIARDAVHVFVPNKKDPVATYLFTQIANWGPSNASFFIMTGSFMQPQKYVFQTKQANDLSELLHLYMNKLVQKK